MHAQTILSPKPRQQQSYFFEPYTTSTAKIRRGDAPPFQPQRKIVKANHANFDLVLGVNKVFTMQHRDRLKKGYIIYGLKEADIKDFLSQFKINPDKTPDKFKINIDGKEKLVSVKPDIHIRCDSPDSDKYFHITVMLQGYDQETKTPVKARLGFPALTGELTSGDCTYEPSKDSCLNRNELSNWLHLVIDKIGPILYEKFEKFCNANFQNHEAIPVRQPLLPLQIASSSAMNAVFTIQSSTSKFSAQQSLPPTTELQTAKQIVYTPFKLPLKPKSPNVMNMNFFSQFTTSKKPEQHSIAVQSQASACI